METHLDQIADLMALVKKLHKLTRDNQNTKVEIKRIAIELVTSVRKVKKGAQQLDEQNKIQSAPPIAVGPAGPTATDAVSTGEIYKRDQSAQTVSLRNLTAELETLDLDKRVLEANTEAQISELVKEDWPKVAYRKTSYTGKRILGNANIKIVIISDDSKEDNEMLQRLATAVPALNSPRIKAGLKEGGTAVVVNRDFIDLDEPEQDNEPGNLRLIAISETTGASTPIDLTQTLGVMLDKVLNH